MRLLKMGLSVRLLKPWGFSQVDSLLADKVQMHFPHVHPFIFPPGFSSISGGLSSRRSIFSLKRGESSCLIAGNLDLS